MHRALAHMRPDSANRYEPFPLTALQQAYILGRTDALPLGTSGCQRYFEFSCPDVDVDRLGAAWQCVVRKHEMLRAIVVDSTSQRILPAEEVTCTPRIHDFRGRDAKDVDAALSDVRREMSEGTFDPSTWPLFDLRVSLLDGEPCRVHFCIDLLMIDAAALMSCFRQWQQFYTAPDTAIDAPAASFRCYVLAVEEMRERGAFQFAEQYWRDRLDDLPRAPSLPYAGKLAEFQAPTFSRREIRLEPETWKKIEGTATWHGISASSVLLATFADVLSLFSQGPAFAVNVTTSHRLPLHPAIAQCAGMFTSPVLVDVGAEGETLRDRIGAVQNQLWRDFDNRAFGAVELARLAQSEGRSESIFNPIVFTSTLSLLKTNDPVPWSWLGDLLHGIQRTPQVALDCQIHADGEGVIVNWDAAEPAFRPGVLDDMFAAQESFLREMADKPEIWREPRLKAKSRLLPKRVTAAVEQANATEGSVPEGYLHTAGLSHLETRPLHPAVITPDREVTYEELYAKAHRLGRRLRELGASPGQLIGLVMDKGWEQVPGALGIMASSAAYLPIDPSLPQERIDLLLERGDVSIVVTQPWIDERVTWPEGVTTIRVDDTGDDSAWDSSPLEPQQQPSDLAYVIFTSGSTGTPKGVMIDHRGALNTVMDMNERFGVGPDDRAFGISAMGFDLSVYDVFGMLAAGGTLVLPAPSELKSPMHWAEQMKRTGVTIWNSVPALLELLLTEAQSRDETPLSDSLRLVMLSGDWIGLDLPDRVRSLRPGLEVHSLGGATEASIWSIAYPIGEIDPSWKSIPYGKALKNQEMYVLDDDRVQRPFWVPGHIYIGGVGLAKGYWKEPEKSAARFIEDEHTGKRLYATGDLGLLLPDGNIEFLGRDDGQVKIRGHRIELGEIESALRSHPSVQTAYLLIREGHERAADQRARSMGIKKDGPSGPPRLHGFLIGYWIARPGADTSEADLLEFLASKLPDYMLPRQLIQISELPLSPNGKVDRRRFPDPILTAGGGGPDEPMSDMDQGVRALWGQTLGLLPERIGPQSEFFRLGGNSLLLIELANRVNQEHQIKLPVSCFFQETSLEGMCALLRRELDPAKAQRRAAGAEVASTSTAGRPGRKASAGQRSLDWFPELDETVARQARLRIFCFPHAGGGTGAFHEWRRALPPTIDVRTALLPGREARLDEDPYTRLEPLVDDLSRVIEPLLDRPYVLFGHSLGALIAYGLASRLQQSEAPVPELLVVSGRAGPGLPERVPRIHDLERDEFVEHLKSIDRTSDEIFRSPDVVDLLLKAVRADFEISEMYEPERHREPHLQCPVIACNGVYDSMVTAEEAEQWAQVSRGEFTCKLFPGGHFFLATPKIRTQMIKLILGKIEHLVAATV